ncbi:hypothetical protein [Nocardia concava]|uniref:hypothetical protein n=1 Tax=Nocardia concava TaxID=257281 RepID=UPI0003193B9E|nr:hypothetical protein [Nocardia concava]
MQRGVLVTPGSEQVRGNNHLGVEPKNGVIIVTDSEGIGLHMRTFEILAGQAVYGEDAKRLIGKALETHQTS